MTTLRPGYTTAPKGLHRHTGAIPTPRHQLAAATPHKYLGGAPDYYYRVPQTLSMWLNDQEGDCVSAEEAFNQATQGVLIGDDVLAKFVNRNGLANGAMLDQVLDLMVQQGFSQDGNTYLVGQKSSVDYTNWAVLTDAIFRGSVKIGIASGNLDGVVDRHNGWFLMHARQDNNEDHCVSLPGYGTAAQLAQALQVTVPPGVDPTTKCVMLFTWKTIGVVAFDALLKFTGEAWLRQPNNVIKGTGTPTPDVVVTPTPPTPPQPPVPPVPPVPPLPPGPTYHVVGKVLGLIPFRAEVYPAGAAASLPIPWQDLLAIAERVASVVVADVQAGKSLLQIAEDVLNAIMAHPETRALVAAINWQQLLQVVVQIVQMLLPLLLPKGR